MPCRPSCLYLLDKEKSDRRIARSTKKDKKMSVPIAIDANQDRPRENIAEALHHPTAAEALLNAAEDRLYTTKIRGVIATCDRHFLSTIPTISSSLPLATATASTTTPENQRSTLCLYHHHHVAST